MKAFVGERERVNRLYHSPPFQNQREKKQQVATKFDFFYLQQLEAPANLRSQLWLRKHRAVSHLCHTRAWKLGAPYLELWQYVLKVNFTEVIEYEGCPKSLASYFFKIRKMMLERYPAVLI